MRRGRPPQGYTIVEVMIFLIITGVLIVTGLLVFNGRQQRTQFTQGVREIDAQIRTIINETASGYYPNKGNISCTSSNGGGPQLSTASSEQGTNAGCIFLGRVLQFSQDKTYTAYSVVGQQFGADGKDVTALGEGQDQARQMLITPTNTQPDLPDTTETFNMPWGIKATLMDTPTTPVGAFGIISSLGSYASNGTDLISGKSGLNVIPLVGTSLSSDKPAIITATGNMAAYPKNPGRMILCLLSGGGNRRAAIIIGGNNNNTGTEVVIDTVPEECPDV